MTAIIISAVAMAVMVVVLSAPHILSLPFAAGQEQQRQAFEDYHQPDFGITLQRPFGWTMESDDPWLHSDINPWHLPLIPIKELQPIAADILLEGKKTMLVDFADERGDDMALIRVSVEKIPFGMSSSLESYAEHTIQRIGKNNENVEVLQNSPTSIGGNPAIRLVVSFGEPEEYAAKTMQILTLHGNLAYIFQYDSSAAYFDANLETAQQVFDSVSISPPTSRAQVLSIGLMVVGVAIVAAIGIKVRKRNSSTLLFLRETKRLFPSAFGIEVLCVASAEIGGFLGLWYYGFNALGIAMAYVLAYALAGFTTFASIVGRSAHAHHDSDIICGCAGMAGHNQYPGFAAGIKQTFVNFAVGLRMMGGLHKRANAKQVVKASLIILLSAESGCIIAAATVDILLYQYSIFLSIPTALLAGTLTVAVVAAYRSVKKEHMHSETKSQQH